MESTSSVNGGAVIALAHGMAMPEAVGFGKSWVTECRKAAYPIGNGLGPVSALFRLQG